MGIRRVLRRPWNVQTKSRRPRSSAWRASVPGRVCGRYQLAELLGRGGMADVYMAYRLDAEGPRQRFALKLLQRKWAMDPQLRCMFDSETRLVSSLDHPNLVRVFESGEHLGLPFMVMEYVDGVSTARVLRGVSTLGERVPPGAAIVICMEVLKGLHYAHTATDDFGASLGIVHRDVSPGNILISRTGSIKLADFGIARSTHVDHHTDPGQVKGKFGYMSPEQVAGDDEIDGRSDLFSLGVVLCEMLLGQRLFAGKGEYDVLTRMYEADLRVLDEQADSIPPELLTVLRKALERDCHNRFQSAEAFSGALAVAALRMGVVLDDAALLPWLFKLGVLPSQSGTYELKLDPSALDENRRSGKS
jgi:serine/threonine-protein kinase